ncbi:ABC transporter substrate binding protein [uncultured Desulfovibrio sp.]|uniref:ABC transporter substrate binding protein n=1 Tax=uncultured Desulfovibrio sp. TaxID=167968 RepID=UPI002633DFFF|nr:ABC transporter substrate binding protein [uncultured Desulfovibrio sp.]
MKTASRPFPAFSVRIVLLFLLAWSCAFSAVAQARPAGDKAWRVIYVEGGPFSDYQRIFQGLALGLEERGLIENGHVPLPSDSEETQGMWQWLASHAGGERIVFLPDGFYSAGWDKQQRERIRQDVLQRIRERKDVDMILAFGTWAGQDFSAQDLPVPVIVSSVTNAVDSGIIPSVSDSGRDNLVAPIEPDRFKRQVLLFHDIFAFKTLGIAYEDTPAGRGSIALNEIEDAAGELGVTLVRCTDTFDIQDANLASDRLLACHKKLAEQGVEAVYLTYNVGLQADAMRRVLQPLADARIPTFSQLGSPDVVHGALLSVAQSSITEEGRFSAGLVDAILKGARPRDLSPVFESPVSMALNLFMATLIGWNPPLEVLAAVDEFYQEMK